MSLRSWTVPILIAVACLAPLALALVAYYVPNAFTREMLVNPERTLLSSPVPLPAVPLRTAGGATAPDWARYRWSLIYARITPCEGRCAADLGRLTAVYLALGRNRARVQRVLLLGDMPNSAPIDCICDSARLATDNHGFWYVPPFSDVSTGPPLTTICCSAYTHRE